MAPLLSNFVHEKEKRRKKTTGTVECAPAPQQLFLMRPAPDTHKADERGGTCWGRVKTCPSVRRRCRLTQFACAWRGGKQNWKCSKWETKTRNGSEAAETKQKKKNSSSCSFLLLWRVWTPTASASLKRPWPFSFSLTGYFHWQVFFFFSRKSFHSSAVIAAGICASIKSPCFFVLFIFYFKTYYSLSLVFLL